MLLLLFFCLYLIIATQTPFQFCCATTSLLSCMLAVLPLLALNYYLSTLIQFLICCCHPNSTSVLLPLLLPHYCHSITTSPLTPNLYFSTPTQLLQHYCNQTTTIVLLLSYCHSITTSLLPLNLYLNAAIQPLPQSYSSLLLLPLPQYC